MLKKLIIILVLSLMVFVLNAQQGELSAEEFQQRRVELQRMANRFKQETGFEGEIQTNHQVMKLSQFSGRFPDITFPAMYDTLVTRQLFDEILDRILPFLSVPRNQISFESIGGNENVTRVRYKQRVNGYEIEGGGSLRIAYYYRSDEIAILNVLVHIDPTPVTPVITEEQALEIFYNQYPISDEKKKSPFYEPLTKILYSPVIDPETGFPVTPRQYLLCWRIVVYEHRMFIDAVTGKPISYGSTVR